MAGSWRRAGREGRGACVALALLALLVNVLVPPGYMLASPGSGAAGTLVICTGHGPLTIQPQDSKSKPAKGHADSPCAFAGHGAPPTLQTDVAIAAPAPVYAGGTSSLGVDLVPGRGLAAPPPPSQGPPVSL